MSPRTKRLRSSRRADSRHWSQTAPARRLGPAILACTLIACVLHSDASLAETSLTPQDRADDGGFLAFAPAPARSGGLCLVDTGVSVNPDTKAALATRIAIDGGTGDDTSPQLHGTVMAMMAAAPQNGWGMIGTAPTSIKIVSVRILSPGQTTFPFTYYTDGIATCLQRRAQYNINTINLSLGSQETPSSEEYEALSNEIETANDDGVAVVAAAGNDNAGPLDYPAAYPTVLSVSAIDTATGEYCPFANKGNGLRLIAPGCDLLGADPLTGTEKYNYWLGSSEASTIAAAALTAMRAYNPDLSVQEAESDLSSAHNGALDIAAAFRLAGLAQIVAQGEAAEPPAPPADQSAPTASITTSSNTPANDPSEGPQTPGPPLPAPRVKVEHRHTNLVLILKGHPNGARTQVRMLGHPDPTGRLHVLLRFMARASQTVLQLPAISAREIKLRYIDPYDTTRTSPWTTITVIKHATRKP